MTVDKIRLVLAIMAVAVLAACAKTPTSPDDPTNGLLTISRFDCDAATVPVGGSTTCRWAVTPTTALVSLIATVGANTTKTLGTGLPTTGSMLVSPAGAVNASTDYTVRASLGAVTAERTVTIIVR